MYKKIALIITIALTSIVANASDSSELIRRLKSDSEFAKNYYKIENTIIENNSRFITGTPFDAIILIGVGKLIYSVVKKGRPVINTNFEEFSVLPENINEDDANSLNELFTWKFPVVREYTLKFINALGMEVITFNYTINFQYGELNNGFGKYLKGIKVVPGDLSVSWGYDLDVDAKMASISNIGSSESDVIAAATVIVNFKVRNLLNSINMSDAFFIDAKGGVKPVGEINSIDLGTPIW